MKRVENSEYSQQNQNQFAILAEYYDLLNRGVNYRKVADYIEGIFDIYGIKPEIILDLACGTGNLTLELDSRGYDMIGLDLSYEMLSAATRKKRRGRPEKNILWTNQDMTDFELYGTVDAVVCAFDSLNYIVSADDLKKCFKLVYNYLNFDGTFIFDVNSKYKFEEIYGRNDFVIENKNILCVWRNSYNKRTRICDFDLTFFVKQREREEKNNQNAQYMRYDETQREKYHSVKTLIELLKECGFEDINIFYDFDINSGKNEVDGSQDKERICFTCIKKQR